MKNSDNTKALTIILGSLIAASLSSCGINAGSLTVGTTSYLREANRVRLAALPIEPRKASLGAVIPKHLKKRLCEC